MMARMGLEKNYSIYFRRWKLRTLCLLFVSGIMEYRLALSSSREESILELLLKELESYLTKFRNKFIKRRLTEYRSKPITIMPI
jgi:restriction endonuclease